MNDCLFTRLKGIISDASLLKYGEFRLRIDAVASPAASNRGITLRFTEDVEISVSGTGAYFTDSTLSNNLGTTLTIVGGVSTDVFVSNVDAVVSISNKYAMNSFSAYGSSWDRPNYVFDAGELKFSPLIYFLWQGCLGVYGNIDAVCGNGVAKQVNLQNNTIVSGNVENWSNSINILRLSSQNITGNINNSQIFGNNIENLTLIKLGISGDLELLSALANLSTFTFTDTQLTGDMGDMAFYANTKLTGNVTFNSIVTGAVEDFANILYAAGNRKSAINLSVTDNMTYNSLPAKTNYGSTAHINLSGGSPVITF
jgi:hypothetical protein